MKFDTRAFPKNHYCNLLHAPLWGIFCPNEIVVICSDNLVRVILFHGKFYFAEEQKHLFKNAVNLYSISSQDTSDNASVRSMVATKPNICSGKAHPAAITLNRAAGIPRQKLRCMFWKTPTLNSI